MSEFFIGMAFCSGLVLTQKLANAQKAIQRHSSQKAVAVDARIPESRLAAKLNATGDAVLNLRDLDKMPEEIQRTFHFLEVLRLGLPSEIRMSLKIASVIDHEQKRSA